MLGLFELAALALLCSDVQAMKLDFLRFPRRALDLHHEVALHKRAPTYITNITLPDTNYTYIGCYTDSTAKRVLTHDLTDSIPGGAANMTVANCARAANSSGYEIFGIEYSQECWADRRLDVASMLKSNSSCSMPCKGNSSEWCGAGDFLQTYQLTSNITEIVYFREPTTNTPATTATTAATATPTGTWHALGCYQDLNNGVRVFTDQVNDQVPGGAGAMTNEACQATCGKLGFPFAGTEYYGECFCSKTFNGDNGIKATADCNTPCRGDASQMCGGPARVAAWGFGDAKGPAPVPETTTTTTSTTIPTTVSPTTTSPSTTLMGWKYLGCYTDLADGVRTFGTGLGDQVKGGAGNMTNVGCQAACSQAGFKYCGTEWSQECFGSNTIAGANKLAVEADCSYACKGNSGEKCGAGSRLSAWEYGPIAADGTTTNPVASPTTTSTTTLATVVAPSPTSAHKEWKSIGCYFDGREGRTFPVGHADEVPGGSKNMTNAGCTATCESFGFTLAGSEYSSECWCGHEFNGNNGPAPAEDCNMACSGNSSESCGAGNRLSAWQLVDVAGPESTATTTTVTGTIATGTTDTQVPVPTTTSTTLETTTTSSTTLDETTTALTTTTSDVSATTTTSVVASPTPTIALNDWNSLGCYFDQQGGRALSNNVYELIPGGVGNLTTQNCRDACRQGGFAYSGQEYAQECWCGNTIQFQNGVAPLADCNMACSGNKTENCGAGNRLTMWGFGTANGTAGSAPVITTPAGPVGPAGPAPTQPGNLPANWTYTGCYIDNAQGRIMPNQLPDSANLTSANCINECAALGYKVAGTQYSTQCFCGNALYAGAALTDESQCSNTCSGNSFEKCGAGNRMSVFTIGNLTSYAPPTHTNSSGNWTYVGCWTDKVNGKPALLWQVPGSANNSAETCLAHCQEYGYMTGGMQYGRECGCGDWDTVLPSGSTLRPDSECAITCTGNPTQICGDGNRYSLYNWTGTPLYEFGSPQGADRGEYSMMIGGLVIPLIATLGINNKVSFLEKHGTGAPNSTGAYELDPSQVGNPAAAWRELHGLKTDVFCAAGVTLPDKAGRQLNIGGWSVESLFGVRLFTPDGSEGVKGVGDWEENYNEIALQRGRWYPSAMGMANGSVLIVGGEHGSNGVAEPTLEILPNPAGGQYLYMDWLARTDPFNLYPFMYVLPSGGIFVAYYNEARILDPVTFATRNQLPNMPGSVASDTGGRSYPLEGTAMMLPQYAPYSDPVTIIVCGGADLDGQAFDNCVSIQPDVGGAQWTLERMPTPRVMTNMVNLPDGRFLIMGGAKRGHAGFGLGEDPNNQAILYDPTKPVNSRMSLMGTTDIARMYHSETILLPDGSVLVTGSDPEDGKNPQEYRMERFSPDYMQNGRAKPSFNLASGARGDWSYGGSYSFSVNMPSGGTPRVSLMGAVSATHGNSMGQRHYFPAVSCGGSQCTVTAPPTPEICVPGWYQMFVLDGPTPSVGQWVRIGGDPADTGSWPKTPSFHPPGSG